MRRFSTLAAALVTCLAVTACAGDDGQAASEPDDASVADGSFDRDEREATARSMLGLPEDELTLGTDARVVRRGDEQLAATMDHVPGRLNIELDDDGSGELVVSKVVVEVPDDEDLLVVEP